MSSAPLASSRVIEYMDVPDARESRCTDDTLMLSGIARAVIPEAAITR